VSRTLTEHLTGQITVTAHPHEQTRTKRMQSTLRGACVAGSDATGARGGRGRPQAPSHPSPRVSVLRLRTLEAGECVLSTAPQT